MKKVLKVGGYARVSHEEQKKFGYSINTQIEEIKKYCELKGYQLVNIYIDEGYSASNMNRPKLMEMLDNLNHLDIILFTRLDRLSRNVFEANKILHLLTINDVSMIATSEENIDTTTANGKFVFNLKVNLAQHELDKGSERIKAVFDYKIKNGHAITGRIPLGYKLAEIDGVKKVIKDPETEHIVNDFFDYFLKHQSTNGVVRYINNKYNLTRTYETYSKMLKNDFYTGVFHGNLNYTEPYISKDTFDNIQEILKKNIRTGLTLHTYIFSGLIRCYACNTKMSGVTNRSGKYVYTYYRCNQRYSDHICDNSLHISEAKVEKYILDNIDTLIPEYIAKINELETNVSDNSEVKLKELKKEMDNLNYMFMKKRIDIATYDKLYEDLEEKMTRIQKNSPKNKNTQLLYDFLSSDWRIIYNDMSKESKRTLWRNIISEIHFDENTNVKEVIFI